MDKALPENLEIRLPIVIKYSVLESVLRKRMAGEYFQTEKKNGAVTRYAKILDISLQQSPLEEYDLLVDVKFKTLTTLFRNREGHLFFHASLDFNNAKEELLVREYKLAVDSSSWILDKTLQTIANKFIYKKLKNKMAVELKPVIQEKLTSINQKLADRFEPKKGIFLSGDLDQIRILKLNPGQDKVFVLLEIKGETLIEIEQLAL